MNYTITPQTKRIRKEEKKDGKMVPLLKRVKHEQKDKDGKDTFYNEPVVELIEGFILRADDAMIGFYKTRSEAVTQMEKEKLTPSPLAGMDFTIEYDTKRNKIFKDGEPLIGEDGKVVWEVNEGYFLRSGSRVYGFSKNREDLVKKIQSLKGISDPVVAEQEAKPKKPPKKRGRMNG